MDKTLKFITKANTVHNNFYDYSKSLYIKSNELLTITCPIHGDFQKTPHMHITFKVGCPSCTKDKGRTMTTETFIKKATKKHGQKFDYSLSNYTGTFEKVTIICSNKHTFEQRANDHLSGHGCPICQKRVKLSLETFKEEANQVHSNFYTYPEQIITFKKDTAEIICPVHGVFKQSVKNHLKGSGCKLCGYTYSGWTKTTFKNKCNKNNQGLGTLYVLRCFNNNEEFYKIGITSHNVSYRYRDTKRMPYSYEVINEVRGAADAIYDLENILKTHLRSSHYTPEIPFGGSLTECFKILP